MTQEHDIEQLALWRHDIPGAKHAVLPPGTARPNPLALDNLVVASLFSPGMIYAVERSTGEPRWRFDTKGFGDSNVLCAGGVLYGKSANTLYALEPESARLLWTFCPYEKMSESIYSSPVVDGNRLFIGDRRGWLHCLSAQTGETLWREETLPGARSNVNASAVVHRDLVVVATNARNTVAFEKTTGRLVWRQELDGPSTYQLHIFEDNVLVQTQHSLYLLNPTDGDVVRRERWKPQEIEALAVTDDMLLVATQPAREQRLEEGRLNAESLDKERSANAGEELTGIRHGKTVYVRPSEKYLTGLRWASETRMVYESRINGFGIIEPQTGERLHSIRPNEKEKHCLSPGLADVCDDVIYLLADYGTLYALRHP